MKKLNVLVNIIGFLFSYQILRAAGMTSFFLFLTGFLLASNNKHFRKRKLTISTGLLLMIFSFLLPAILYGN